MGILSGDLFSWDTSLPSYCKKKHYARRVSVIIVPWKADIYYESLSVYVYMNNSFKVWNLIQILLKLGLNFIFFNLWVWVVKKNQNYFVERLIDFNDQRVNNYRTRAIITHSWFESTLEYKPRSLGPNFLVYYISCL